MGVTQVRVQLSVSPGGAKERLSRVDEGGGRSWLGQCVPRRAALRADSDEATLEQEAQVPTHRGLCETDVLNQIPYSMLAGGEVLQDGQSSRVSERVEQMRIHFGSVDIKCG
jgi:hypothetical protein